MLLDFNDPEPQITVMNGKESFSFEAVKHVGCAFKDSYVLSFMSEICKAGTKISSEVQSREPHQVNLLNTGEPRAGPSHGPHRVSNELLNEAHQATSTRKYSTPVATQGRRQMSEHYCGFLQPETSQGAKL